MPNFKRVTINTGIITFDAVYDQKIKSFTAVYFAVRTRRKLLQKRRRPKFHFQFSNPKSLELSFAAKV